MIHGDESMSKCISEDRWCRDNDASGTENSSPDVGLPSVNSFISRQESYRSSWNEPSDRIILLNTERNLRCEKPYQL